MKVPFFDLVRQFEAVQGEIRTAFDEIFKTQQFILGPQVSEMEKAVAEYCGVRFAIGVASGSDALFLALMALDIGPGDEVILPSFTFFATGGAVSRAGAVPVFADIDPETYNLDPLDFEKKITPKTKAVIPVHLYGQCADMDPILQIAKSKRIAVIEDAAQALGADYKKPADPKGRGAGQMGELSCFSFFPTKNLGAFGDAGLVASNEPHLGEKVRILRVHGSHPKYFHKLIGINSRIDTLQAAVIQVKLKYLEKWTLQRQRNAARYQSLLGGLFSSLPGAGLPVVQHDNRHIFNQYVIRVPERDHLRRFLQDQGIGTEIYYPVPLHLQECFSFLNYQEGDLPHSEKASREVLALPVFPELKEEEQDYVIDRITAFYKK
jgi:dTDP-4-amino-4,6-dideoxygalactose transaminase